VLNSTSENPPAGRCHLHLRALRPVHSDHCIARLTVGGACSTGSCVPRPEKHRPRLGSSPSLTNLEVLHSWARCRPGAGSTRRGLQGSPPPPPLDCAWRKPQREQGRPPASINTHFRHLEHGAAPTQYRQRSPTKAHRQVAARSQIEGIQLSSQRMNNSGGEAAGQSRRISHPGIHQPRGDR